MFRLQLKIEYDLIPAMVKDPFLFLLFWLAPLFSQAQNPGNVNVQLHGQAQVFGELAHKPSSKQGQTQFDFSLLQLSPEIIVQEKLKLYMRFVLAEQRSTTDRNFVSQLQNAAVQFQDFQNESITHEVGLFRNFWHRQEGLSQRFEFFSRSAWSLSRRYRFLAEGDLGYQGIWNLSEASQLTVGFSNGEENREAEKGAGKDFFMGYFSKGTDWLAQVFVSAGRVDRLDPKITPKNRALIRGQKTWGRFTLGVEGVYAEDPSQDLETYGRLEGITFTDLAEPIQIQTRGGRVDLMYQLSDQQSVLLRADWMEPRNQKRGIQSNQFAWTKMESELMRWGLMYEWTELGAQHSSQSKVREWARVGLELAF